ncbi:hypothetical protein [Xaviernesmea rhizosphaerae]|nr:hypothetical protein [Xaviernesmea rhizosphaerae]
MTIAAGRELGSGHIGLDLFRAAMLSLFRPASNRSQKFEDPLPV